jgi:hypothetical protein
MVTLLTQSTNLVTKKQKNHVQPFYIHLCHCKKVPKVTIIQSQPLEYIYIKSMVMKSIGPRWRNELMGPNYTDPIWKRGLCKIWLGHSLIIRTWIRLTHAKGFLSWQYTKCHLLIYDHFKQSSETWACFHAKIIYSFPQDKRVIFFLIRR